MLYVVRIPLFIFPNICHLYANNEVHKSLTFTRISTNKQKTWNSRTKQTQKEMDLGTHQNLLSSFWSPNKQPNTLIPESMLNHGETNSWFWYSISKSTDWTMSGISKNTDSKQIDPTGTLQSAYETEDGFKKLEKNCWTWFQATYNPVIWHHPRGQESCKQNWGPITWCSTWIRPKLKSKVRV